MAAGWLAPSAPALSVKDIGSGSLRQRRAAVLFLAPVASAISLSNFQLITSSAIPLSCILAYNEPLAGCSVGDFTSGRQLAGCSSSCRTGIRSTQLTLRAACVDVLAPPGSVLGEALLGDGNLVPFLCGSSTITPPGTASIQRQSPTVAVVLSPTSSSVIPNPSLTTETPPAPEDGDGPADETSTATIAFPTGPGLPSFSETAARQTQGRPPPDQAYDRGGGSPFDSSAPGRSPPCKTRLLGLGVAVGAFLLWR